MITSNIETITPDIAAALLEAIPDNRVVSRNIVEQYASDMKSGRWQATGEPIIISSDGLLNDGQHRLTAVCKSNVSVNMMVVRGVARETRIALNIGKSRKAGDILQMFHISSGRSCAALANTLILYERSGGKSASGSAHGISKPVSIERALGDDRLQLCVSMACKYGKIMSPKHVAFARYVIPDSKKSDVFFDRLFDGIGLDQGNPILTLRNWILRNGKKQTDLVGTEVILRAWCAFRDDRLVSQLKILGELPKP